MPAPVIPGCQPWSADGGDVGVLVCHGYTGSPQSLRPLAEAFAEAGFTVELPLWPGHGTSPEDLDATSWSDWCAAAELALTELASRCTSVAVAGLSMGGTLATWLATHHPEVVALVLVNPMIEPPAEAFRDMLRMSIDQGVRMIPAIGSDIAKEGADEVAYDATPIEPLLSLFEALDELQPRLCDVRCPVLLCTSRQDHVVPPSSSDLVADGVSGPVERLDLERSYHVATLDHDGPLIAERAVAFVEAAVSGASEGAQTGR